MDSPDISLFRGSLKASPLGWVVLYVRQLIRIMWFLLIRVYTLLVDVIVSTITAIFQLVVGDWMFLLIMAGGLTLLFLLNLYYQPVVDFTLDHLIPFLQFVTDLIVTALNLLTDLYDILVQVWNICVPLIGFIIYFVLDLGLTIFKLIIDLLHEINLPRFMQDIMEIVTFLVQLFLEFLKGLMVAGQAVLQFLVKILVVLLKVVFSVIRFLVPILKFLLITLFKVLKPILFTLVRMVSWFLSLFAASGAAARQLLALHDSGGLESGANLWVKGLHDATHGQSQGEWDQHLEELTKILEGLEMSGHAGRSATACSAGKCQAHDKLHQYIYKNDYHEITDRFRNNGGKAAMATGNPAQAESGAYRPEALDSAEDARRTGRRLLQTDLGLVDPDEKWENWEEIYAAEAGYYVEEEEDDQEEQQDGSARDRQHDRPASDEEYEAWLDDYLREVGLGEVAPGFEEEQLREHRPLSALLDGAEQHSNKERLERSVRGIALVHAIEEAAHHVYQEHIAEGHLEWALSSVLRESGLGFESYSAMAEHAARKYHSAHHMMYDLLPDLSSMYPFRFFKEQDEERYTKMYFHEWLELEHGISSKEEMAEHFRRDAARKHCQRKFAADFGNLTRCIRDVDGILSHWRQLKAIRLEVLYERDCQSNPKNFLCLPRAPKRRLKAPDLRAILLPFEVDRNAACHDLYKNESCSIHHLLPCFFSWNRLYNAFQVFRFWIYVLDIPWLIFPPLGLLPKPSELVGLLFKLFPWLDAILGWYMLFDYGYTPSIRQYICWFIHLWDFMELLAIGYIYRLLLRDFVSWLGDCFSDGLALWTTWRQDREERYSFLQDYNESYLHRLRGVIERQEDAAEEAARHPSMYAPIMGDQQQQEVGAPHRRGGQVFRRKTNPGGEDLEAQRRQKPREGEERAFTIRHQHEGRRDLGLLPSERHVMDPTLPEGEKREWCRRNLEELQTVLEVYDGMIDDLDSDLRAMLGVMLPRRVDEGYRTQAIHEAASYEISRRNFLFPHHDTSSFRRTHARSSEDRRSGAMHGAYSTFADPFVHAREVVDRDLVEESAFKKKQAREARILRKMDSMRPAPAPVRRKKEKTPPLLTGVVRESKDGKGHQD